MGAVVIGGSLGLGVSLTTTVKVNVSATVGASVS